MKGEGIMKKRKIISVISIIGILTMLVVACSKKDESYYNSETTSMPDGATAGRTESNGNYDTASPPMEQEAVSEEAGEGLKSTSTITTGEDVIQEQDKIIRTFYLDVETQEFDSLITKINAEIKRLRGYTEKSDIKGKGYYNNGDIRYGSVVARIPSDKVDEFVKTVNDKANVTSQQESSENVSLKYIEAESRIETLKIEQERLFAILEQELNLDNIITLESRLSNIRYELQNYESQLRYYDNQVAYSTVTLSISEVEKYTPVVETKLSLGERISTGFGETMYDISEGIQNFIVWFLVNLPYLIIWGIIIAVAVFVTRKSIKKRNAMKTAQPGSLFLRSESDNNDQKNQGTENK